MPDGGNVGEITITLFYNAGAARKTERRITWQELQRQILTTTRPRKTDLLWLKLARFGDVKTDKGSLRHDDNVLEITGIEADYDGEMMTPQQAVDKLDKAGIRALVYTSPSHSEGAPRWRVLCPTSGALPPDRRAQLVGRLNGLFGGVLAGESFTLSQSFYFGRVGDNPSHMAELVEGRPIDLCDELDEIWIGRPATKPNGQPGGRQGKADTSLLFAAIVFGDGYHQACVRLAGVWARGGVPYMEARKRLEEAFGAVPEGQRDERWKARREDVDRCLEDIYGKEAEKRDGATGQKAPQSGASPASPSAGRFTIRYVPGKIAETVDRAEEALLAAGAGIYQRGTFLVRMGCVGVLVRDGRTVSAHRIVEVGDHALVEVLTQSANWEKLDGRSGKWVPSDAPLKVAMTYQQRIGKWKVPVLSGIINAPTLRPDGSVLDQPGYDVSTGLLLVETEVFYPPIPTAPTQLEALLALGVLERLLGGFPFVDKSSKAVALSCILSACIRRSLPTAPLHGFTAPAPGSGKSFLVDIVCLIASGREAAVMAQGRTAEELEKRLGAMLLAGDPVIAIDNCDAPLGGDFLCAIITQQTTRIRILGRSEAPELPSNSLITATGNNLQLEGDMARRALLCQLDPREERPELREFSFNPATWVKEDRGKYVAAVLTVLRAYRHAGCPNKPTPLASFEDWSNWVRGALIWLGQADPVETMEEVRDLDPKRNKMVAIVTQWGLVVGADEVTVSRLIDVACAKQCVEPRQGTSQDGAEFLHPEFREALLTVAGVQGAINSARLGNWLRGNKDRLVAGHRITRAGTTSGVQRWRLEEGRGDA